MPGRASSLVLRILAGVVFIPCFIIIVRRGGLHFLGLVWLVIYLGMWEFYRMLEGKHIFPRRWLGIAGGLLLAVYLYEGHAPYAGLVLTVMMLAVMGLELTRSPGGGSAVSNIASTFLGVMYVAFLSAHLVMLREFPREAALPYEMGASFVYLAFVATWSCDTGAFFVGSAFGKRPLLPRVSEKKTREGALGGVIFAIAGVFAARATFAPYLEWWHALTVALIGSTAGIIGDLVESLLKRDAAIKDASTAIPGHGGVLDRFDSLLFTAPLLYYLLKFVIF